MIALVFVGCPQPSAPIQSTPAPPAVQLGGNAQLEPVVVFTDLKSLFEGRPVDVPRTLAGLVPDQPLADARGILDTAREAESTVSMEQVASGWTMQAPLAGRSHVTVTLILDAGPTNLREVDLSLPEAEALLVLTDVWGDPVDAPPLEAGHRVHAWTGDPWDAELHAVGNGRGILRFFPAESDGAAP